MEIDDRKINYSRIIPIVFYFFVIVDSLFYQVQAFTVGSIIITNAIYKMLLVLFYLFLVFYNPRIVTFDKFGIKSISIIVSFLFITLTLVNGLRFGYSTEYMTLSFLSYDIYFLLFSFSLFNFGKGICEKRINKLIFILLFISLLGGFLQLVFGTDLFLKNFGARASSSSVFFDKDRLFSFYSTALVFGLALTVFVFYFIIWFESKKLNFLRVIIFVPVVLLSLILIYETYTRNVYLYFLGCLFSYLLLHNKKKPSKIIKYIPYILLSGILFGIFFILPIIAMAGSDGFSLFYSDTATLRFSNWDVIFQSAISDPLNIIIGTGLVQHGGNHYQPGLLIDNTFIAIFYQYGLLGVCSFIFLFHKLWVLLLSGNLQEQRNKWIVVIISPCLMAGIFNTTYHLFLMYSAFYFCTQGLDLERVKSYVSIHRGKVMGLKS